MDDYMSARVIGYLFENLKHFEMMMIIIIIKMRSKYQLLYMHKHTPHDCPCPCLCLCFSNPIHQFIFRNWIGFQREKFFPCPHWLTVDKRNSIKHLCGFYLFGLLTCHIQWHQWIDHQHQHRHIQHPLAICLVVFVVWFGCFKSFKWLVANRPSAKAANYRRNPWALSLTLMVD